MERTLADAEPDIIDNAPTIDSWNRARSSDELLSFIENHRDLLADEPDIT